MIGPHPGGGTVQARVAAGQGGQVRMVPAAHHPRQRHACPQHCVYDL